MQALIIIFSGFFGFIVGSFLNVVIFRMNTGHGVGGRSKCLSCGKTLSWSELIPLISFLIQGGKCKSCRSTVSWQYPLVEGLTGLFFAGVAYNTMNPWTLIFWFVLIATAVVIAVYDLRHKIIPTVPLVLFIMLSLLGGIFITHASLLMIIVGGIMVPLPFFLLWIFSQGRLMGFGDVEIMGGMGMFLGMVGGFSAVALAFWIATTMVLVVAILRKIMKRPALHRQIPFAPFLLFGVYLVGLWGLDVFAIILGMR